MLAGMVVVGQRVLLQVHFPPGVGIDLIAAFYGCLYAGCVPITVRPPHPQNIATTLPTVKMIVEVTHTWARHRPDLSVALAGPGPRSLLGPSPAVGVRVCVEST